MARFGLIIYGHLNTISGGYLYDRKMVAHLREAGDEVEVISLPWSSYGRHLTHNFWPDLRRRLANASFDCLLQDELNHPSLFWLNRRLRGRYPLVSIIHHLHSSEARPAWQNSLYRWLEKQYLRSVDGFIFNSQTSRQVVHSLVGAQRPGVVAYPAGDRFGPPVTEAFIRQRSQSDGPLRLLFVGNLIPRKGLHILLEAVSRLPPETWQLAVVGRPDIDQTYTRRIKRLIASAGLEKQVTLRGPMEREALAEAFQQAHLLAVPSSYEGFGIVYLEGMGFGLPAIAGAAGAAREIITHDKIGFLVPPDDAGQLARCIAGLAANRTRLTAMGLAARQRFAQHPTWRESGAQIRRFLLEEIIGRG